MPPKTGLEKIAEFNQGLRAALPDTIKFRAEVQLITKSFDFLNRRVGEGIQALNQLETMQVALNKTFVRAKNTHSYVSGRCDNCIRLIYVYSRSYTSRVSN